MDKIDDMQEEMGSVISDRWKSQEEKITDQRHCNWKTNVCNELISRMDTAQGKISELDDILIETSKNK